MSERDDRYAANEQSRTGEFRAAPDISASTAQFKAFASGLDSSAAGRQGSAWPEQPWAGDAPGRGSSRMPALIIGAIVLVAVLIVIVVAIG